MSQITGTTLGGAIWTPEFVTTLDPKKCIGCGRCFKVCPRSVLDLIVRGEDMEVDEDEDYDPGQDYRERVYYLKDGTEVPDIHRVPIPVPDTLPHYKHSYLPPDEAGIAAHRAFRAEYPLESP